MPSTYTTNLGIEKIGSGEQNGTWGDTVNTNMDLLDAAINGIVVVTLVSAGTTGAPNDINIADGATSDGRNAYIQLTGGDLGGTIYVRLTSSSAKKMCHVENAMGGSRDIVLFQGTYSVGRAYTLKAGKTAAIKFSGEGDSSSYATNALSTLQVDNLQVMAAIVADGTITGSNLSGTNTGNQTNLTGITDTKANFDTACSDGNFMYVGDAPTAHTHTFASLTSKPTTLSGYAISDTKANFNTACSDGSFLFVGDTAYTLPEAAVATMGGVKLFSDTDNPTAANTVTSTASRTYGLQLNASGQGVVNVPWTDTNTTYSAATTTTLGTIKLEDDGVQTTAANTVTTTASRTYGLQVNASGQGVVNVPWTDSGYSLPAATSTVLGGIELASDTAQTTAANGVTTTASRTYGLQVNAAGQGVVNVPWVLPIIEKSITIEAPTSGDDVSWFFTNRAITATELRLVSVGTSVSSAVVLKHATDRSAAGTTIYSGTITSTTTGHDITSFSDATIPADSFVWWEVGTTSGTITNIHGTLIGTID